MTKEEANVLRNQESVLSELKRTRVHVLTYQSMADDEEGQGVSSVTSTDQETWGLLAQWRAGCLAALRESLEFHFQLSDRGTTIEKELYAGFVQFVSCIYILPVVSRQLESAGYHRAQLVIATATVCAMGCILSSYTTNLPFVVAPPTSVSIFLAVALQRNKQTREQGDTAVVLSGLCLLLIGVFRSASRFVTRLIPDSIQASTAVGIGLITALAGAIEIGLVVQGDYTLLAMGEITPAILIGGVALLTIAVSQHYHFKGSFILGLAVGSSLYWLYDPSSRPTAIAAFPRFDLDTEFGINSNILFLVCNLIFLYILTLNGLARSFSDLAGITNEQSGTIPRGNWLFIICGITTILSGLLSGPPILISPESAAGIKAGARTGLSTLVAGLLFFVSIFYSPLFSQIPASGTSPLLFLVGMVLFQNVARINWSQPRESISAFFVLLLIPFTYSIICGVSFGYIVFVAVGLLTGDAWTDLRRLLDFYHLNFSSPAESTQYQQQAGRTISEYYSTIRQSDDSEMPLEAPSPQGFPKLSSRRASSEPELSAGGRRRGGSILDLVDRIPMDLEHGSIRPMIS